MKSLNDYAYIGTFENGIMPEKVSLHITASSLQNSPELERAKSNAQKDLAIMYWDENNKKEAFYWDKMRFDCFDKTQSPGETDVPSKVGFEQFRSGNDMGERPVFFGNAFWLRREHQRRNTSILLSHTIQDVGNHLGIIRLSKKQIAAFDVDVLFQVPICRRSYKGGAISVANEVLMEKTGNEVILHIENRSHGNNN